MAAAQRTTGANRLKGPVVITMRGAGSKGHDAQTVGVGADVPLSLQIPSGQTANAFTLEKPDGTVIFVLDKNGNMAQGSVLNSVNFVAQVTLTAANLIAMYTTPVAILLAQAAGTGIIVDEILFQMKATATAFTSGGIVTFQYGVTAHGAGTLVHAGSIPASVINAGAGNSLTLLSPTASANGLTIPTDGTTASGLYISNATGVFATGTGTAIATIYGSYVTLG